MGALHNIPVVLVGALVLEEKVSPASVLGFSLCILGALVYTHSRVTASSRDLQPLPAVSEGEKVGFDHASELYSLTESGEASGGGEVDRTREAMNYPPSWHSLDRDCKDALRVREVSLPQMSSPC